MSGFQHFWEKVCGKVNSFLTRNNETSESSSDGPGASKNKVTEKQTNPVTYPVQGFLVVGNGNWRLANDCVKYDVTTKQHQHLSKLKIARLGATSVNIENKAYVMGGDFQYNSFTPQRSGEVLDLNGKGDWETMPNMLEERFYCGSGYIAGCIFVTGGSNRKKILSCSEKFDVDKNEWFPIKNMLHKRREHGTVACNGSLYCIGGNDTLFGNIPLSSCERYDVETDTWVKIASLKAARACLACVELGGMIYAIGGATHHYKQLATVERYSPSKNKWEYVTSLKIPRKNHCACVVHDKIYVIGGILRDNIGVTNQVEVYDPASNVWTTEFKSNDKIWGATAVGV